MSPFIPQIQADAHKKTHLIALVMSCISKSIGIGLHGLSLHLSVTQPLLGLHRACVTKIKIFRSLVPVLEPEIFVVSALL